MKKIILILVCSLTILGCSTDEETNNTNPELQSKLIGTWEYEGYYDDVATDENPDGFFPTPSGFTITYFTETFSSSYLGNPLKNGNYNVSNDSLLTHNDEVIGKIVQINDSKLIVRDPSGYGASRYGKISE